jgi:transposase-like protein
MAGKVRTLIRFTSTLFYIHRGYLPLVKQQITDMVVNGSGMRDPARVLKISRNTVTEELKKSSTAASGE